MKAGFSASSTSFPWASTTSPPSNRKARSMVGRTFRRRAVPAGNRLAQSMITPSLGEATASR